MRPVVTDHETVVIDGSIELLLDGGNCDLSIISDSGEFGVFTALHDYEYPPYTGDTVVIPKADDEQVLPTLNKTVLSNITVLTIPYTETSNPFGGYTVSIG